MHPLPLASGRPTPRPRPDRFLVLRVLPRSAGCRLSASSPPRLTERGLRGGLRPPLGRAGPGARDRPPWPPQRPGRRAGLRRSAERAGATRSARSARTPRPRRDPGGRCAGAGAAGGGGAGGGARAGRGQTRARARARARAVPRLLPCARALRGWASARVSAHSSPALQPAPPGAGPGRRHRLRGLRGDAEGARPRAAEGRPGRWYTCWESAGREVVAEPGSEHGCCLFNRRSRLGGKVSPAAPALHRRKRKFREVK